MSQLFKLKTDLRVFFEDVDAYQVVHNAKFFCFFERGRLEYLRHLGFVDEGPDCLRNLEVVIAENYCSYKKPAILDDILTVCLRISFMKRSSFQFQYIIIRKNSKELIACGYTTLVCVDRKTLKPTGIKPGVKNAVEKFEGDDLGKNTGIPEIKISDIL